MSLKRIGWIGTGVMGKSMCSHILKAGYTVTVFNRTKANAEELLEKGALWAETPSEVARGSEIIFSIVGYPADVSQVVLGPEGVLKGAAKGSVFVDMTTSEPELAKQIFNVAGKKGVESLDAPVSGGDIGAREARLAIMAGGKKEVFNSVLPLFEIMGKNIRYMGEPGAGQHTKMVNQIHIASTMIGLVEALLYAYKAGIDLNGVIEAIGQGAAGSWSLNNYGPRIASGDFNPGFFVKHFVKDMDIALKEARGMKLSLPGLSLAHQFYVAAMAEGYENLGTHSLYKVFERMNGI